MRSTAGKPVLCALFGGIRRDKPVQPAGEPGGGRTQRPVHDVHELIGQHGQQH